MVLPSAGGLGRETVATRFDSFGRPISMGGGLGWGGYVSSAVYSPYGDALLYDVGNTYATYLQYTYSQGTRRLMAATVQREGVTGKDLNLAYAYDDAGNPLSVVDSPVGQPVNAQCYGYDGLRRLTEAWTPADGNCSAAPSVAGLGGPRPYWFSDTFDLIGNRTSRVTHAAAGDLVSTYTYPASGPDSVRPHALLGVTTTGPGAPESGSFGYDAAGNTLTRDAVGQPAQGLTWDIEGELTRVFEGAQVTGEYVYSADGDRLVRREAGVTTVYLPGGQELSRVDATGVVTATRYYAFNGKTLAMRTGSGYAGVTSLVADPHATAEVAIDNGTNALTRRYTDPYGNAQGPAVAWTGDHGFLDKPVDATGLVAIGARYYDPGVGRFISVDPVMTLTDPQQWAAYSYANNNPITYWDPTGLWPEWLDNAASSVGDAIGEAASSVADTASSAWNATTEWVDEHKEIVDGVVTGLGIVAAGACIVVSAGACAVVAGVALAASVGSNAVQLSRGNISAEEFWIRTGVDVTFAVIPGVRAARAASQLVKAGGAARGFQGTLLRSYRGQHAAVTVSGQLRNAVRSTRGAWRDHPLRAAAWGTLQTVSGARSAVGY